MKLFVQNLLLATAVVAVGAPAIAQADQKVRVEETRVKTPDGGVVYEQTKTITREPVKPGAATFYYYDPDLGKIVTGSELTDRMIGLWDKDNNKVIDNHEFYSNALIVYEPREYTHRTYQDIDGEMKMTKKEYTLRLQQLPSYRNLNKDGGEGLTIYEFTGVGFQDADHNNNNQVSFEELRQAFWAKEGVIRKPLKLN
jgi:hypothetical protein